MGAPSALGIKDGCLFTINGLEEVRQSLCCFSFWCLFRRRILGDCRRRGRWCLGRRCHVSAITSDDPNEILTFLCLFRGDGPSILKISIRRSFVRLVLDPVLLEIWIVQVFLQGSDEGDRGLGEKVSARLDVSEVGDITCFKLGMGTLSRF